MAAQSTHCFAFVGKHQSGIGELAKRGTLPACQGSPRAEQNRASNTLKIHPPALHVLICLCAFSVKTETFSRRSQVLRLPREVATQGACLLPAHLAGKPAQNRSRGAGQPRSPSACLPAKTGELPACQSWAPSSPSGAGSSQAAGRLREQGSPVSLEPRGQRSGKRREPDLVATHSGGCQGVGQLLSLSSWEPARRARQQIALHPT